MAGISKSLLFFLEELKQNNNKDWFEVNKPRYQEEEKKLKLFGAEVTELLNITDSIEKMKVYRIYKDVRFSKDKTPYKANRGLSFTREGEARRGSYFLNIEPGNSFIGGGFFAPNPQDLLRIRKEFETDASEIRELIAKPEFSKVFGNEFVPYNQVKTAPKGFSKTHPAIDLIKNKSFFFQHNYSDKEIQHANFSETIASHYQLLRPFFDLMSDVLTTDLNGVSTLT